MSTPGPYSTRCWLAMGDVDIELTSGGRVYVYFDGRALPDDGTRVHTVRVFPDLVTAVDTLVTWPSARGKPRWKRTG